MLKSMNFLSGKSRGIVSVVTKSASPAPVILGRDAQSVPRILWQRVSNIVNKLALLLHKCWFTQDSWDKPKNDRCRGRGFSLVAREQRSVAVGNKVMDTRLPQPAGCGDKYDVSGWYCGLLLSAFCMFFKYPSPDAKASPSPSRGEGLHRPWCDKILGTDCASRPRMTGGRGVGFVRLLRCARNDVKRTNILSKGLDVVRQCAALLERRVQTGTRARKALAVTRQANPLGRSMIEMLGVLAIIGVLSVGGIAGYSKAMLMWHSNKQKDLLTTLINNAITLKPNLSTLRENRSQTITDVFSAMGGIPEGFTYKNNVIYDADNNSISITYGIDYDRQKDDSLKRVFKYAIRIAAMEGTGKLSISMKEYCKNLIMAAQSAPNEVLSVDFSSIDSDSWSGTSGALIFNRSTLGQTSPAQINKRCNIAIKENGRGYFRILLNPN